MDFKNLWVGDKVYVKSKAKIALWEDQIDQTSAKLKIDGNFVIVELSDIDEFKPGKREDKKLTELKRELNQNKPTKATKISEQSEKTIDLHIEKLKPDLARALPQMILNHQLMRFKVFLDDAIDQRKMMINVIHGKGNGTLKAEVNSMLKNHINVKSTYDKNEGGTTEVWFQY